MGPTILVMCDYRSPGRRPARLQLRGRAGLAFPRRPWFAGAPGAAQKVQARAEDEHCMWMDDV